MKEGKKKTNAKKKMSSSSKKAAVKSEPPKVKKIEVDEINKDFDDVENEDKRLIVFIAIAILVIVGTVIGLLVGCEKKENEKPTPDKPGTDVVVPEKPDEKGNDDGVKTKEIVRKVRSTYVAKSSKKTNSDKKTVTYNVTFYLGEDSKTVEVEKGKKSSSYVPTGYSSCSYYKDENFTEEYDITAPVSENVNVYMQCSAIEYSVVYESADSSIAITTTNPTTYMVTEGEVTLSDPVLSPVEEPLSGKKNMADPTVASVYFGGWFADKDLTKQVTSLNKDVLENATDENVIYIYARITDEEPTPDVPEEPTTDPTENPTTEPVLMAQEVVDDEVLEEPEVTLVEEEVLEETEEVVLEPEEVTEEVTEEETEAIALEEVEVNEEVTEEETKEETVEAEETVETEVVEEVEVEKETVEAEETKAEAEEVVSVFEEKVIEVTEEPKEEPLPVEKEVPAETLAPVKKEEPTKKVVEEKETEVEEETVETEVVEE